MEVGKASATARPRPEAEARGRRRRPERARPTWGRRDAGALLGAQRRHGPAAGRAHGRRLHVQLPVEVVVVAQAGAADRGRQACAAGGHGARVEGAIVRGGGAAGAVERVPVQGRKDDGGGGAGSDRQHRVLAARPSGQDVVDAEHAGGHPRAPCRDRGAEGARGGKEPQRGGVRAPPEPDQTERERRRVRGPAPLPAPCVRAPSFRPPRAAALAELNPRVGRSFAQLNLLLVLY